MTTRPTRTTNSSSSSKTGQTITKPYPPPSSSAAPAESRNDFTPMNTGSTRPPSSAGNGSTSARRTAHASSTATAILNSSTANDSDDDDAGGEGMGRRLNLKQVMMQAKAEAAAAAREGGGKEVELKSFDDGETIPAAGTSLTTSTSTSSNSFDIDGPPTRPAQLDEENELFYCPRLTPANLQRITGETDLSRVTKLSLHLNTEEQELSLLNILLPSLQELNLIPPSFVSSFRDFGQSLTGIRKLSLPHAGLIDLDGIEFLTQLKAFHASGNNISDLSPLMFASQRIEILDLSKNKIKEKDMIEFIGVLVNLRELELDGNPISMCTHYRSIVASRCPDIPSFKLDGVLIKSSECQRLSEKEESLVDKTKLNSWQERSDDADAGHLQAALQRKVATAEFNTLASGVVRPSGLGERSQMHSQANSQANSPSNRRVENLSPSNAVFSTTALADSVSGISPTGSSATRSGPALSASLGSSGIAASTNAMSTAAKKREYQRFLEQKEAALRGDPATAAARRAQAKSSAVADILRLENEMREEQASGVAKEFMQQQQQMRAEPSASQSQSSKPTPSGVPRLQFDAAFSASSPHPSPEIITSPSNYSAQFNGKSSAAVQPQLSLSTPRGGRPSSASGQRPGTASGLRSGDGSAGGDEEFGAGPDSSSDLTYGSDSIMAGNYAQAMRARKKQGSISISSGNMMESKGSDESRSPSSTGRASTNRGGSRSSSPAPSIRISSASLSSNHSSSQSQQPQQPIIVLKGGKSSGGAPSPPVIPPTASPTANMQPSRPLVIGSGNSGSSAASSMLQRHLAASSAASTTTTPLPVGSPLAAARASQQSSIPPSSNDEVVFVIGAKKPGVTTATTSATTTTLQPNPTASPVPPTRSTTGKTYTLVRNSAPKK